MLISLSIRRKLQVAAVLVAAFITLLAFLRARERRAAEERNITRQSQETATLIARSLDATIVDAHTLLNSLSRLLDPAAPKSRNDAILRALYAESPVRYSNIYLADSVGRNIGAVRLPQGGRDSASAAPRPYVDEAKRTKRFAVGVPVRSRMLSGAPWVMPFISPIMDSVSGSVRALVGASIYLDSLDAIHIVSTLPPGSIVSVIDSTDRIVLRSQDADAWIGKTFPQAPRATQQRIPLSWGTFVLSSIDSVERLFGAQRTTRMPWRVYVGIPTAFAFGPSRRQFVQDVLLGLLLSFAVAGLGYWIVARFVSPIESLTRDANAISTGDMARRSTIDSNDEVGTLARTFNTMADAIGERNAALASSQAQLRQAQKLEALGSFAGGVAHDFNNYLSSIIGHSEMALADLPDGSPVRVDVEGVLSSAHRAAELTRQILVFSRQQAMVPELLDPNVVIADIERMIARLLGEAISLTVTLAPRAGVVRADRGQIEQVVMNLAANARDAMPTGGRFLLTTATFDLSANEASTPSLRAGRYIRISASDTGTGISSLARERIFEPFFTTKDRGHGTGLGLALSHGIVQQSGGAIQVDSTEGRGTTFHIYLPLVAEGTADAAPCSSEAPTVLVSGSERLLLVEDDEAVAAATTRMLRRAGFSVDHRVDGHSGLDALDTAEPAYELVVTDVVMPGMSGADFAREVSVRYPQVKVLFISGYPDDDELVRDVAQYRLPFLAKPFSTAVLLKTVRDLLDAKRRVSD